MIKIIVAAVFLYATLVGSSLMHASTDVPAQVDDCLDWKIETYPAGQSLSSCAYFNPDKVSTRFVVNNQCASSIKGIFSYYSEDSLHQRVVSVQPFEVRGQTSAEVANPCDVAGEWTYHVTQID